MLDERLVASLQNVGGLMDDGRQRRWLIPCSLRGSRFLSVAIIAHTMAALPSLSTVLEFIASREGPWIAGKWHAPTAGAMVILRPPSKRLAAWSPL